jgi:hypothetical protein
LEGPLPKRSSSKDPHLIHRDRKIMAMARRGLETVTYKIKTRERPDPLKESPVSEKTVKYA